jgi:hypothetical protein
MLEVHNRQLQDAGRLRQHQRIAFHLLEGNGLHPAHGADLMVDQQQGGIVGAEFLVSHDDSPCFGLRCTCNAPASEAAVR